jgi:DNA-binding transcriptional LysR family regulator
MTAAPDISPRLLTSFVTLAEERSFTRTAARLHLTQSCISRHLTALERDLDVKLLTRSPHNVELTPAGQRLLPHAQRVLHALNDLSRAAKRRAAVPQQRNAPVACVA